MTTFPHITPCDIAALEDQRYYDAIEQLDEKPAAIEITRGELVCVLRSRKGWTKGRLAREAGLSRNYIRMIENGEADNLGEKTLFALADALDVNASQLMERPDGGKS